MTRLPLAALCTSLSTLTSVVYVAPCWADDGAVAGSASGGFGTVATQSGAPQSAAAPPAAPGAPPLAAQAATAQPTELGQELGEDTPPVILQAVPPTQLIGPGLLPHHYDANGYPESSAGLLIVELDPTAGPITLVMGQKPHYLEAQFATVQRDGVWLARKGPIVDVLPNGGSYEIPYGYGAVKRSLSAVTLVEAQVQPHVSDNQKSYEVFPLSDWYLGATLSLVGLRADLRYVAKERYVGFAQAGVNVAGLAGAKFNRTYGAFAVPVVVGGGIRYPSLLSVVGSNWTTGAEVILGLGSVDKDLDTADAIALPGLFHEVEWTFDRQVEVTDYRTDPRPYNYGVHSLYAKIGAYPDFLGGATKSLLFDLHIGYRYNFKGPDIPHHPFKETRTTYASERYVQRKLEEERRRQELEQVRQQREQDPNAPAYPAPGTTAPAAPAQSAPGTAPLLPGQPATTPQ